MGEFIANNFVVIAMIVSTLLTLLGTILTTLSGKHKKSGKMLLSIGNVVKNLPTLIKTAEQIGGSGEDKKTYVMEQVMLWLRADGVTPSDSDLVDISTQIDNQIKLTKELHTVIVDNKGVSPDEENK